MLALAAALLVFALPASVRAGDPPPTDFEKEAPDALTFYQYQKFDDPNQTKLEVIFVTSDTPEGALHGYEQVVKENSGKNGFSSNPYENTDLVGMTRTSEDTENLNALLNERKFPVNRSQIFEQKELETRVEPPNKGHSPEKNATSVPARPGRSPAALPTPGPKPPKAKPLSRLDLLKIQLELEKNPDVAYRDFTRAQFEDYGKTVSDEFLKKSKARWVLVGVRGGGIGGFGTYAGMSMSNIHPVITAAMAGVATAASGSIQAAIDPLADFLTKTNKLERGFVNLFIRTFTANKHHWDPKLGGDSSKLAFYLKWFATEFSVNELTRLAGYFLYANVFPEYQLFFNGATHIPESFQINQGLHDSFWVAVNTELTQAPYEHVVMTEYNNRVRPYRILLGYYKNVIETSTNPELVKAAQYIVDSCMHRIFKEWMTRSGELMLGSASWIMALAFRAGGHEVLSTISSYSLLAPTAGLHFYFKERRLKELKGMGFIDDELGKKLEKMFIEMQRAECTGKTKSMKDRWREFKSEIVPTKKRTLPPPVPPGSSGSNSGGDQ